MERLLTQLCPESFASHFDDLDEGIDSPTGLTHLLHEWARALDIRDGEAEGHSARVAAMAVRLAEYMGESGEKLVHIMRGALLHDIGKISVPDSIMHKAGSLTEEEWTIMREHPYIAFRMLSPVSFLVPAIDIPHCHHERWDGGGYPRGLRGTEIPRSARIFTVIHVYDALTSDRPYRPGWSHDQAMEYIDTQSGSQFDPDVVEAFADLVDTGELPLPR